MQIRPQDGEEHICILKKGKPDDFLLSYFNDLISPQCECSSFIKLVSLNFQELDENRNVNAELTKQLNKLSITLNDNRSQDKIDIFKTQNFDNIKQLVSKIKCICFIFLIYLFTINL